MPLDERKGLAFPNVFTNPCGFAAASTSDIIKTTDGGTAAKVRGRLVGEFETHRTSTGIARSKPTEVGTPNEEPGRYRSRFRQAKL